MIHRLRLKRTVLTLANKNILKSKKIKLLIQKVKRQCKKIGLKFLPCYKMSQDHLELFFGAIKYHQ